MIDGACYRAPKLICNTVHQFEPCIENYDCREELCKNKWGRTFAECYNVCQRRQNVWIHEARARARRLEQEEADTIPGSVLSDDRFEPDNMTTTAPSSTTPTSSDEFQEDEAGGNEFFEVSGPSEEEQAFVDPAGEPENDTSKKQKKGGWRSLWGGRREG